MLVENEVVFLKLQLCLNFCSDWNIKSYQASTDTPRNTSTVTSMWGRKLFHFQVFMSFGRILLRVSHSADNWTNMKDGTSCPDISLVAKKNNI